MSLTTRFEQGDREPGEQPGFRKANIRSRSASAQSSQAGRKPSTNQSLVDIALTSQGKNPTSIFG
jgi:hypothetical protein